MWEFFVALFSIIGFCILSAKERKGDRAYRAYVDESNKIADKWFARIRKVPIRSTAFHEKMQTDREFRDALFNECNAILDSIPEMDGIRLTNEYDHNARSLVEMMYNARTGDVSAMWYRGWIRAYYLTDCFPQKPSTEGCAALMEWYQEELRRNGYPEATILPVDNGHGFVVAWRFTDGASPYDMIKHELFIK